MRYLVFCRTPSTDYISARTIITIGTEYPDLDEKAGLNITNDALKQVKTEEYIKYFLRAIFGFTATITSIPILNCSTNQLH